MMFWQYFGVAARMRNVGIGASRSRRSAAGRLTLCAVAVLALGLGGCSAGAIADLPAPIGLPADAPPREEGGTPAVYPAVYEPGRQRERDLLNEEEQAKLERELSRARVRQGAATPAEDGSPK